MADLWKYCTPAQCREFLLSLDLLEEEDWSDERKLSCLYAVSNHVESHYHQVSIRKKNGSERSLLVPDPLLKGIQRRILSNVLGERAVSPYAFAYRRGMRIGDNAACHVGQPMILKLDIKSFFDNIVFEQVLSCAFPSKYYPPSVGTMLACLCCCYDRLPQGAPTSPAISNLVMKGFDESIGSWCEERGIAYSRYCDDLTFSGEFDAEAVKRKAGAFLNRMGFELNREKTRVLGRDQRQIVTGVVVNEKVQVSREYRRKLRQEVYYCETYGIRGHLERMGKTEYLNSGVHGLERYLNVLLGKVNFILGVNQEDQSFIELREKLKKLKECLGE